MRLSRQGYWSGMTFPSPGDLLNPGIKPRSPALQAYSLPKEQLPGKPLPMANNMKRCSISLIISGNINENYNEIPLHTN